MSEWRTIDSAPKDGTTVLVYVEQGVTWDEHVYTWPDGGILHILPARWHEPNERTRDGPGWFAPMFYLSLGLWDDPPTDIEQVQVDPTHWQPLPRPPS